MSVEFFVMYSEKAYDSKVILKIGDWKELDKTEATLEKEIKKKTFELFRRDSRNVEILTFDELFERAHFIAEGKKLNNEAPKSEDDDLPF
jgi:hypothetical protein